MVTRRSAIGVAALIVGALLIGAIGGYIASAATANRSPGSGLLEFGDGKPHVVSVSTLTEVAPLLGVAYWAGDRPDTTIELTLTEAAVYIRYLPSTSAASRSKPVLTVATYRDITGFASLASQSTATHARSGAIIAVEKADPLSTYFAFPSSTFEVEVYSPTSGASMKLVNDGSITPLPSR